MSSKVLSMLINNARAMPSVNLLRMLSSKICVYANRQACGKASLAMQGDSE